ncbi:nuclease-related domain-containing protein [Lentibacillus halophilus]|uniref:nuclease-related domain-containing protein n=1 Tax=Lentibacillus halophilus TaxID=295065 RepID=UPI0031D49281
MIPLHRKKTYDLLAYEALFRCMHPTHRHHESIVSVYKKEKAGFDGERNVDYKLSAYPRDDLFLIKGLRLDNPPFYFQIDTLILTKQFITLLEIKNQQGTFMYDAKLRQLTQDVNGQVKAYKDPILQVDAQKMHLQAWLERRGIYGIPIETLVVVAFPSTVIANVREDPDVYNQIIHTESLHQHLDRIHAKHEKDVFTKREMTNLHRQFLRANQPLRTHILNTHHVEQHHLIPGIPCSQCARYPMIRKRGKWQCPACSATDDDAHKQRILDYFLLHDDTITNRTCRSLLQIDSPRTAYRLLNGMNLKHTGTNKGRKYMAPALGDFPQQSSFPEPPKNHTRNPMR